MSVTGNCTILLTVLLKLFIKKNMFININRNGLGTKKIWMLELRYT